jgi:hypothetical protein
VGGGAVEVELGRRGGVHALEAQELGALADVKRLARADLEHRAVHRHPAGAADVDQAQLAALQEEVGAGVLAQLGREADSLCDRLDAAHDDPVDLAVGQRRLVGLEQVLHHEVAAQAGGVQAAGVLAVDGLADFHGFFLGLRAKRKT